MSDYKPKCERCSSENVYPHDEEKVLWCCRDCGKTGYNWDISKEQWEAYEKSRREKGKGSLAAFMTVASIAGGPYGAGFARAARSLSKMNDADRGKVK